MTILEQVEAQARDLVDVGRQVGEPDVSIRIALVCLKNHRPETLAKVAIQRVINDMDGNPVLKFKEGGSS